MAGRLAAWEGGTWRDLMLSGRSCASALTYALNMSDLRGPAVKTAVLRTREQVAVQIERGRHDDRWKMLMIGPILR